MDWRSTADAGPADDVVLGQAARKSLASVVIAAKSVAPR